MYIYIYILHINYIQTIYIEFFFSAQLITSSSDEIVVG